MLELFDFVLGLEIFGSILTTINIDTPMLDLNFIKIIDVLQFVKSS